ncbi:hypothetical protein J3459_010801 [Metarhizium acridum]|uniref:uncharacterized protein n=1 Tax=Metarhizium acridum TaxID=92637 RepID=UPI001C6B3180|nr:hypothetical protein J3458_019918 [Metarhizium acridum]KAG8421999.1 hypothetical protein J3459_010801 [Metarhizium acridum]
MRMLLPALELDLGTPARLSMCNVVFGAKFLFYMVNSGFPVQLLAHQSICSLSFDVPGALAPSGPSGPSLPTKLKCQASVAQNLELDFGPNGVYPRPVCKVPSIS